MLSYWTYQSGAKVARAGFLYAILFVSLGVLASCHSPVKESVALPGTFTMPTAEGVYVLDGTNASPLSYDGVPRIPKYEKINRMFSQNSRILVFQRWMANEDIDLSSIKICDWHLIGGGLKSEVSAVRQRVENHKDLVILVPRQELEPGLYSVTIGRGPEYMFGVLTPDEEVFWNGVLREHPNYWQAHNHLGGLLYMRGDFNGAYPHFLKAVQINPQNPESHNNLGLALQKRGDLNGAIEQYKDALNIVDSGVIAANLGNAYEQANKLDDAVNAYRRAIALDGSIATAHCNLGYVLMQQGKIDEAIKEFRKTVELDPTMPQGKGDLEEALRLKGGKD